MASWTYLRVIAIVVLVSAMLLAAVPVTSTEALPFLEAFEQPVDSSLWYYSVSALITASQANGRLCLSGSDRDQGGKFRASSKHYSNVPLTKIGVFEVKLMLSADHTSSWVDTTMDLGTDVGRGQWRGAICRISANESHRRLAERQVQGATVEYSRFIPITYYKDWHSFRIEVDAEIPKLFFFLDGEHWGSHVPEDDARKVPRARFTVGVGAFRSAGVFATTYLDDFLIKPRSELLLTVTEPGLETKPAVIEVPEDYPSIQRAIDVARDGDTVLVAAGTYYENLNFYGKDITVRSEAGPDATRIDGGQRDSVVTFENGETSAATLEGFTITNGLYPGPFPFGGGIRIRNASPRIINNVITKNGAVNGGGIYVEGKEASPLIKENLLANNIATEWGGAMAIRNGSSPLIQNNVIRDNIAMEGAGVAVVNHASPLIEGNNITGNWGGADMDFPLHAEQYLSGRDIKEIIEFHPGFGAGILVVNHSSPTIENNTIDGNFSGGIAIIFKSSPRIENNSLTDNIGGDLGGGLLIASGSSPIVVGNTFEGNQAQRGSAIWLDNTSSILNRDGDPLDPAQLYERIEETDESFAWSGRWESDSGECYSGGTRMGSEQRGARVNVRFSGTAVALIYFAHPHHGIAGTSIDGVPYADIDMYAPEAGCQTARLIATGLDPTEHVLTITVTGRKNVASAGVYIVIDAINVMGDSLSAGGNAVYGSVYVQPSLTPSGREMPSGKQVLVPSDDWSIQTAVDSARDGDTIIVAPGVYRENIDFKGKEIILRSQDPDDREVVEATIIQAKDPRPTVSFMNGETSYVMLEGFTIRNGLGSRAIHIEASSPTISNNIIKDSTGGGIFCGNGCSSLITGNVIESNASDNVGGGIECYLSSPLIENNILSANKADSGAGIFAWFSSPSILNNTITKNEITNRSGSGGGIGLDHFSIATVKHNIIRGNRAGNTGGGIYIDSSSPLIDSNIIVENEAAAGGGVYLFLNSSPDIVNNIIAGNTASQYCAGGICVYLLSSPNIVHNTIAFNTAGSYGVCSGIGAYVNSTLFVTNTILWNKDSNVCHDAFSDVVAAYSNVRYSWRGEGNISQDPLFIGNEDYHLQPGSPCIDAGTDAGVYTDIDGDQRPQGAGFDIGADEYSE